LVVTDQTVGPGYGIPNSETVEAVRLLARLEGILLDPVYTGKAMAALIQLVAEKRFRRDDHVVFWHTGGTPALFAYRDLFET
jgi:1-aminocyclopropane-1-carboxylate deaminase/D-cysteine desulfhydrase-like pyridoxal-dependent ACC family enzyme